MQNYGEDEVFQTNEQTPNVTPRPISLPTIRSFTSIHRELSHEKISDLQLKFKVKYIRNF